MTLRTFGSLANVVLLAAALYGCGPRALPERISPELSPTGQTAVLGSFPILDSRRDGVAVRELPAGSEIVRFSESGEPISIVSVPDDVFVSQLVSRADDQLAIGDRDRVFQWDGATLVDETPRLTAVVLGSDVFSLSIEAIDLDVSGALVIAVTAYSTDGPEDQVCWLEPSGGDGCENVEAFTADLGVDAVLSQSGRVYLLSESTLAVRGDDGVWRVQDQAVGWIHALDGERTALTEVNRSNSPIDTVILDRFGAETQRFREGRFLIGHGAMWEIETDSESDGSCGSFSLGCREPNIWAQMVVWAIDADGTRRERGHLSAEGDVYFDPRSVPLPDGTLWLEENGQVYRITR